MLALTVLTALNTFNGGFLVASRFMYAAARENNLPRPFAKLNMNAVPWVAVTSLTVVSAIVAALVFATGQWLMLVSVGAAIECAIYAIGSLCVVRLCARVTSDRPFRMVFAKPLASFGVVLFSALFLATAFADPKDSRRFSVVPFLIIAVLGFFATLYVALVVPRLERAAAARNAERRPTRRPPRPGTGPDEPVAGRVDELP